MTRISGVRIHINGIVQGVGFRPFIYGLAVRLGLKGWVRNTSAGVDIEVDGDVGQIEDFVHAIQTETPALAKIDTFEVTQIPANGFENFEIVHSEAISGASQPISPDVSICEDCIREMKDPADRRFRYPFINCTNCGPRFTIIRNIPYDRPLTTMAPFKMCQACEAEYQNPLDRRFHAQPVACPDCGPQVWLETGSKERELPVGSSGDGFPFPVGEPAIRAARRSLQEGKILAIKGLGGFHLACDATNPDAVNNLRQRKLRVDKPFALMMMDIETVERHCQVNNAERRLLLSRERPIVLLWRKEDSPIAHQCAPGQDTLGVMLPYTPLHYLLLESAPGFPDALVMTSGNLSEEPIATDNNEARSRLNDLADGFLMHNRAIETRCDDSVVRVFPVDMVKKDGPSTNATIYPLRRSRGYAPFPVHLPWQFEPILATGAELKNTFCLTKERYAFLSHHIGDLENYETLCSFEEGIAHFERLFRVEPQAFAYDLHPNYLASQYVQQRAENASLPAIGIQHHHAHIAACMTEYALENDKMVIGVAFDGTGYGDDGAIWGGEFLLASYRAYQRYAHLAYIPMPGGDLAVRQPWRLALAWLAFAGIEWSGDLPPLQYVRSNLSSPDKYLAAVKHQIQTGTNAPNTSSMGRLFDAVSALIGVRNTVNYEAQAAIELEALCASLDQGAYTFTINAPKNPAEALSIDPTPLLHAIVEDQRTGQPAQVAAARFHLSIAMMVLQVCQRMRRDFRISDVVLSGGVWQNMTLLRMVVEKLVLDDFNVFIHRKVPTNDGGIALGQAAIAINTLMYN